MKQPNESVPAYRLRMENGAYAFTFFCMASGAAVCTTKPVQAESEEAALELAWNGEARSEFNLCHCCGKWVADVMYNADTLKCVDCSPWEETPCFCSRCGEKIDPDEDFCHKCRNRLRYGMWTEADNAACGPTRTFHEKPEDYGFGNEIMKRTKVCSQCGSVGPSNHYVCAKCGGRLHAKNLFQVHQSRNRLCPRCDTILASYMEFCPHCGKKL